MENKKFNVDDFVCTILDGDLKLINEMKKDCPPELDGEKLIRQYILGGAVDRGNMDEVKKLIKLGYNTEESLYDGLISAALEGNLEIVKYFIEEKNMSIDKFGLKCVSMAVEGFGSNVKDTGQEVEVVKYFQSKGVDIHGNNDSLYKEAVVNGGTDMIKVFLDSGSDIKYVLKEGDEDQKTWAKEYKKQMKNNTLKNIKALRENTEKLNKNKNNII